MGRSTLETHADYMGTHRRHYEIESEIDGIKLVFSIPQEAKESIVRRATELTELMGRYPVCMDSFGLVCNLTVKVKAIKEAQDRKRRLIALDALRNQ